MPKKKTLVPDASAALGTGVTRLDRPKKPRAIAAKHSKAKVTAPAATVAVSMTEREEVALVAYLYFEARGFQGGSPEEDWVRAEQEVRARRS